jgi:hypothetical protein
MELSVQFPLTLTLSPEERESAAPLCEHSLDGELFPERRSRLPLLGERVRVRGNGSSQQHRYGLGGAVELDWKEVSHLAGRVEYRILPECKALVREVANELKIKSPLDSY